MSKAKREADEKLASKQDEGSDQSNIERFMDSPAEKITKLVEHSEGWDGLEALAKADPVNFLALIWPWFHEVFELIKHYKNEEQTELFFPIPYALDYRFQDEGTLDLPEPSLLTGIRAATEALAAQDPIRFRAWLVSEQDENAMPAQRLLAHTLSTNPEQYAADALAFLLSNPRRFTLGSIEDYTGTTKRLINAVMGGVTFLPTGNFPILEAISRILLQRHDYAGLVSVLNDHLARPEDEKVWIALLRLFPFIRLEDKAALADFYWSLFQKYPRLATCREAAILLAQIHWSVPDFVRDTLAQWAIQPSPFVQQAYGELTALIWLVRPNLDWPGKLIKDILVSDRSSPARTGAGFAAVNVWAEADDRARAANIIRDLTKNASDETWKAIVDLFRIVDEITPDADWVLVLQAIAEQIPNQSRFMSTFIIERLQTLLPHEADLVASISTSLVEKWQSDLGDIRTSGAAVAPELVDIAITLHRLGPATREKGLEIFERLLAINAYTARDTLNQVDKRKAKMSALSKVGMSVFDLLVTGFGGWGSDGCCADEQARAESD